MLKIERHLQPVELLSWNQFKQHNWPGLTNSDYREVLHLYWGESCVFHGMVVTKYLGGVDECV